VSASYRHGIRWIAGNDEPGCLDLADTEAQISVLLLADLFGKSPADVAKAVVRMRTKWADGGDRE